MAQVLRKMFSFLLLASYCGHVLTFGFPSHADGVKSSASNGKLLLLLVDGCRWDYPDQDPEGLSGFRKLAQNGVRAPYVTPIFPSNSYPNWYSLVTGLYAENHGFVQNMMYDSIYEDFFLMGPNETVDAPHWWQGAEPLWITAEKSPRNIRSALYWWDGCQVEIRGRKPTFCRKYKYVGHSWPTVNEDTKQALLNALQLMEEDKFQLVQIYYEPVDYSGHKFGPNSNERKIAVKDIDTIIDFAQTEMESRGLLDKINFVVVSDHGMTSTDPKGINVINLTEVIDVSDLRYMVYSGASSMLLPQEGKLDKIYSSLKEVPGLNVFLKEEIPEHYHLKNNRLILPIFIVASQNYYILGLDVPGISIPTGSSISPGSHGYDPFEVPDMRGIFFARGPGLRQNHVSPPLQMVDIYNILCELLNIQPLPNNGTKSVVSEIVVSLPSCSPHFQSTLQITIFFILFCLCFHRSVILVM